jgi:hypothetical protein
MRELSDATPIHRVKDVPGHTALHKESISSGFEAVFRILCKTPAITAMALHKN